MIFYFSDYNKIDQKKLDELLIFLPEKRVEKVRKYRFIKDKISCTIAYLLFLYGYQKITGNTDIPEWDISENGKPFLALRPDLHFNVSHCDGAAVCAFSDKPIGIDIQNKREIKDNVIKKVCSDSEIDSIKKANDEALEFCRIWTIKEAITKLSGDGIACDLKKINEESSNVFSKFLEPDMYFSVAGCNVSDFVEISYEDLINI